GRELGRRASFFTRGLKMTRVRRLLGVFALLGFAALVSSNSQGQSGKKAANPGPALTPQTVPSPATQVARLAEETESRFSLPAAITNKPLQGSHYVALHVKPALEPSPRRPRDILIMVSTSAAQAGAGFIAGHQIAEGIIKDGTKDFDRVSLWSSNEPKFTKDL